MVSRCSRLLLLALLVPLLAPTPAWAVEVVSTSPKVDATVVVGPSFVSITADEDLLEFGNEIVVISPSNQRVDDGLITVEGKTISVGMLELSESGKYLVEYELLSSAESPLFGNFSFTFQAPPAIDEPETSPTPGVDGAPEDQPREVGSSATDYLVIGLLVLAFFIMLWLARFARSTFRKE